MSDIEATGGAEAAAPSPAENLATLTSDAGFQADWSGDNGRPAQIEAVARKAELTKAAYGPADEPAQVLPEQVQAGLDAPDAVSQAAAEAMTPAADVSEYQFKWQGVAETSLEDIQAQNQLAAETAFAVGANAKYARTTVEHIDQVLSNPDTVPMTEATFEDAMNSMFGDQREATIEAARDTLMKMPEDGRDWVLRSIDSLDASTACWFIQRLATVSKANAPKL